MSAVRITRDGIVYMGRYEVGRVQRIATVKELPGLGRWRVEIGNPLSNAYRVVYGRTRREAIRNAFGHAEVK